MPGKSLFLLATLLLCSVPLFAQSASPETNRTFQVEPSHPWVDTGLDLQTGDTVEISSGASLVMDFSSPPQCAPKGITGASNADLPLPSSPAGAVIARLHAQGAAPILVGEGIKLQIEEPSHLLVGMNVSSTPPCRGAVAVMVRRTPANSTAATSTASEGLVPASTAAQSATASPSADSAAGQKTRGEQLKSQLTAAAQVFMSGQFGGSKPGSSPGETSNATSAGNTSGGDSSAVAPTVKVSDAPLDADLRKSLDNLPRRVNDQFQNLGDMVNFVIVGNQKDVQAALDAANWHTADTSNEKAVLNAIMETYEKKDYLAMPMSTLYLFGRRQDFGYEMAEPIAMVASRHHFRIWKAPFTWKGKEVWVGAGTHDIGFAKDKRNGNVTHKIDPAVDGERDNIGSSLQKANKTKTINYYLPANPVQDARNATGDGYHSDGRLLVMFLQ